MSCDGSFSLFALGQSSPDFAFAQTVHCLPNSVQAAGFLLGLGCHSVMAIANLVMLLSSLARSRGWNPRKRTFLLLLIDHLSIVAKFSVYLTGHNYSFKFVFDFISLSAVYACAFLQIRDWLRASLLIERQRNIQLGMAIVRFDKVILCLVFFASMGFLLCWTVGPIAFWGQPAMVNWFLVFGHTHNIVVGLAFTAAFFLNQRLLMAAIRPALEIKQADTKLLEFLNKVRRFTQFMTCAVFTVIPLLLVPLWMRFTSSPTDPGLQHFFYFQFFAYVPMNFFFTLPFFLMVAYQTIPQGTVGSSSSSACDKTDSRRPSGNNNIPFIDVTGDRRGSGDV